MNEMTKDHETSGERENAGRRRLVRGVVVFAPLVLTLRSGAAFASCTATKALGTVNGSGRITISGSGTVATGDVCVSGPTFCDAGTRISSGTKLGVVTANGGNFSCGASAPGTVAILSATSAASLGIR